MDANWTLVKKTTLWQYEELMAKLLGVFDYPFACQAYDHSMPEAADYAGRVRENLFKPGQGGFIAPVQDTWRALEQAGERRTSEWLRKIETRAACQAYLEASGLPFERLVETLAFLLRWVLPFKIGLRELNPAPETLKCLVQAKVKSNLDLHERARTPAGREKLAGETGAPAGELLALVHRADLSRLPYVRGKTVLHLCGGGYTTVKGLAAAQPEQLAADMDAYYHTLGKRLADFQAVIPLAYMRGGARILPPVVED